MCNNCKLVRKIIFFQHGSQMQRIPMLCTNYEANLSANDMNNLWAFNLTFVELMMEKKFVMYK
jgi:hypothetical protein